MRFGDFTSLCPRQYTGGTTVDMSECGVILGVLVEYARVVQW